MSAKEEKRENDMHGSMSIFSAFIIQTFRSRYQFSVTTHDSQASFSEYLRKPKAFFGFVVEIYKILLYCTIYQIL
jgi:hypothetical protein